MTEIFEIFYITSDGYRGNVLFADLNKANEHLKKFYNVGHLYKDGDMIVNSFINKRILF